MEYVPALEGLLIITASEDVENTFHGNTLYFLPDGQASGARKLAVFEVAMKAEGLAVLTSRKTGPRTTVRLLVTYDNDPHATKIPSRFQAMDLVRESR
jgi:hypothetical protein